MAFFALSGFARLVKPPSYLHHYKGTTRELSPIILILYNASEERAYWLQLTRTRLRALAKTNQATCTVHLPMAQVFDAVAVETIRKIKNDLVAFYERQTTDG